MKAADTSPLPVAPLLRAYADGLAPADLTQAPGLGPRFAAIRDAALTFLNEAFLDSAPERRFRDALLDFYQRSVTPPLQLAAVARRAGLVRHGLAHLLRCADSAPLKIDRCLSPRGAYFVPGLGPVFWSAAVQALDPQRHPAWTPLTILGLQRLGLARWPADATPGQVYANLIVAYTRLRDARPELTALHLDHFLSLVATMRGRTLAPAALEVAPDIPALIRAERARAPLRGRIKDLGRAVEEARSELEAGLRTQDGAHFRAAFAGAPALDWEAHGETLALWLGRLWEADDPYEMLDAFWRADPIPGAGLWLPTATLHLRDARQFHVWDEPARAGHLMLSDGADAAVTSAERYRLFNEAVAWLCERHKLHPLEAPALLAACARDRDTEQRPAAFGGFCDDTFRFLGELGEQNSRSWMTAQRDRYHFAVREPLVELCRALAERYVEPVLRGQWGWDVDTRPRSGKALTSVTKNDYGRSVPYNTALWVTFCRRGAGRKQDAQLFVKADASGVSYGFRLGREARDAGRAFRKNVQAHAEPLFRALVATGAATECRFSADDVSAGAAPSEPGDLRAWAAGKTLTAGKHLAPGHPLLGSDDLVGEILLTFDRLLPAYACAVEEDPLPLLAKRGGAPDPSADYGEADFRRDTLLSDEWLRRARTLLDLKRQLILQGVPGTGKTHVARGLARLLTGGREESVRLVQFHPAYSYEEFVEGIKAKSVEVGGRLDVTYPVEDGLLCSFADEAARHPSRAYVLLIDEINRGNLPRVFGELLYLLEYRDQTVSLPYSRRAFRLPANLYLIGTMNAADRSVALIDQALRRRFSFLEMPPNAGVLAGWLRRHPPRGGPEFAAKVVVLFERLNRRLAEEAGPGRQVGHSYFMVPDLDEPRLRVVWEHQVRPVLEEYFAGQAGRLEGYDLGRLLEGQRAESRKRPAPVGE